MRARLLILALLATACGRAPDTLEVRFFDELVEAPGRTTDVAVVTDADCASLLTVRHEDLESAGTVLVRRRSRYPVARDFEPFEGLPRGRPLSVDVVVRDGAGLRIARSCRAVTLVPDAPTTVAFQMHALPECPEPPAALDLTLVVDASLGMRDANIALGGGLFDHLAGFVESFGVPGGVRFALVAHGPTEPTEVLAPTEDRAAVVAALAALAEAPGGGAQHYAAVGRAAALLRARALCGRRPVILWIGGGEERGRAGAFESAASNLAGTRGEAFDDVFVYALGVSEVAFDALAILEGALELAELEGALTDRRVTEILLNARARFQALVEP